MADNSERQGLRASVVGTLESLDGCSNAVASAVAQGGYVFWLGSGLSRSVVPDVRELLMRVLSFLQQRVDHANENCRFKRALNEIFDISNIPQAARDGINLTTAVKSWPDINDLVERLVDQYAKVLDVTVDDEQPDFLLWEGVDVASTYGSPGLEPAAEHLCLAILVLEGVVGSVVSANWDGLLESAIERLTDEVGGGTFLRIVVREEDFRKPEKRCNLIKFHGCAVKAAADPETYRSLLIARQSQISSWNAEQAHPVVRTHLEHLTATKAALVIGLSVQDANLHTILSQASANLPRSWPTDPPAMVFALKTLGAEQRNVLKITYSVESYQENRQVIEKAALLGAYAQPLLLSLVLYTLADKLCSLIRLVLPTDWDDETARTLEDGARSLRNAVADSVDDDDASVFVHRLITAIGMVLSTFRTGSMPDSGSHDYQPLTVHPIKQAMSDPNVVGTGALGFLAVAASLLGRGVAEGLWCLRAGDVNQPNNGVCTVESVSGLSRVFIVQDSSVLSRLEGSGHVVMSDSDVLVIHAEKIPERQARSPKGRYGRTGMQPAREVAIESIINASADPDGLLKSFRETSYL